MYWSQLSKLSSTVSLPTCTNRSTRTRPTCPATHVIPTSASATRSSRSSKWTHLTRPTLPGLPRITKRWRSIRMWGTAWVKLTGRSAHLQLAQYLTRLRSFHFSKGTTHTRVKTKPKALKTSRWWGVTTTISAITSSTMRPPPIDRSKTTEAMR